MRYKNRSFVVDMFNKTMYELCNTLKEAVNDSDYMLVSFDIERFSDGSDFVSVNLVFDVLAKKRDVKFGYTNNYDGKTMKKYDVIWMTIMHNKGDYHVVAFVDEDNDEYIKGNHSIVDITVKCCYYDCDYNVLFNAVRGKMCGIDVFNSGEPNECIRLFYKENTMIDDIYNNTIDIKIGYSSYMEYDTAYPTNMLEDPKEYTFLYMGRQSSVGKPRIVIAGERRMTNE